MIKQAYKIQNNDQVSDTSPLRRRNLKPTKVVGRATYAQ